MGDSMKKLTGSALLACLLLAASGSARAHTTYIGSSGAPGSGGRCASSCHGGSGGTIVVSGFPAQYDGGQMYTIDISHNGGNMIKQFNASCRLGAGSTNAGVIAAGSNTVTYNTAGETNGVHLINIDSMGGSFTWKAPATGSGEVTLYVAGHQGSASGANTTLTFTAAERTVGVGDDLASGVGLVLFAPTPNPVVTEAGIRYATPQAGPVTLEIFDLRGRTLETRTFNVTAGLHEIRWDASGQPSGVYFCRLQTGGFSAMRKVLVAR